MTAIENLLDWMDNTPDASALLDALIEKQERKLRLLRRLRADLDPCGDSLAVTAGETSSAQFRASDAPQAQPAAPVAVHTHGPRSAEQLAAIVGTARSTGYRAVKHHWFEKEADGYHLTPACYVEFINVRRFESEGQG